MSPTATPNQREAATRLGFRSDTERDAEIARLQRELAEVRAEIRALQAQQRKQQ